MDPADSAEGHAAGGPAAHHLPPAGRPVEDRARGRIVSDAPLSRPVPVALRFDPGSSPATVRFVFPGEVEWAFPRALLEHGLRVPAHRGDVAVWPCGRVQTVVEFHGEDGVAVVQFDTAALVRFLRRTYAGGRGSERSARAEPAPTGSTRTDAAPAEAVARRSGARTPSARH
ncbi:SsgA family sporulation/cell division regulator [Streptomyces sp.]|uniref:SsgA family sporulation/cell division regulator n=1 Tax=Streptomyces sp. TaxID=1931 RepID=UPI0028113EFD|nr:SsgA family sporulation/cell division regulator [Streptomyces sp.]